MVQVMRLESECTKLVGEKDSLHTELLKADSEVVQTHVDPKRTEFCVGE